MHAIWVYTNTWIYIIQVMEYNVDTLCYSEILGHEGAVINLFILQTYTEMHLWFAMNKYTSILFILTVLNRE
jgi:hypothetical protein